MLFYDVIFPIYAVLNKLNFAKRLIRNWGSIIFSSVHNKFIVYSHIRKTNIHSHCYDAQPCLINILLINVKYNSFHFMFLHSFIHSFVKCFHNHCYKGNTFVGYFLSKGEKVFYLTVYTNKHIDCMMAYILAYPLPKSHTFCFQKIQ